MTAGFAYNGDGARVLKTSGGGTTRYMQELAATLPLVISDTDAIYLYGLDIVARKQEGWTNHGIGAVPGGTRRSGGPDSGAVCRLR